MTHPDSLPDADTPEPDSGWNVLVAKPSPPGRPASLARRTGARLLDYAVWIAVLYALSGAPFALLWQLLWSVAWLVVPLWLGGTLGKRLFGVRVVRFDGSALTLGRALTREAMLLASIAIPIIGVLNVLVIVNDPRRQTLHDKVADTMVI